MTKDERSGVVFPLPASYRANDPALTDTSPANIRQILTNARNGQLWDQERLYRTMLDTWPRMVKNLSEFQGAVAGLGLTIEPAKREGMEEPTPNAVRIHDVVSRAIESYAPRPGYWELGLTDMIKALVEPYVKGISALEIVWHVQNGIVSPRCYAPVPGKYLAYPNQSNEVDRLMLAPNGINNSVLEDFPPNKFLIAVWSKGGVHPVYAANLRPLSKYWVASVYGLGWLMQYGQLFGIPWRHVETDGSEGAQVEAEKLLENIGASGWAITTKGVALNILDGVSGSTDALPQVKMMEEADKACDIMLLGQTLTTDVGDSGSRALGDVHAGVRKEKLQDVANWVAGIITDQLIPAIVKLNFGDIPAEDMPYCKIVIPEAKDDKANAERVKILSEIGVEMPLVWVHETVGVPVPVDGEAVFEKKEEEVSPDEIEDDDEAFEELEDIDDEELDEGSEEEDVSASLVLARKSGGATPKAKAPKQGKFFRKSSTFNPNQKRYPKGHPKAGRWMDEGKGSKGGRAKRGVMRDATPEDLKRLGIPASYKNVKVTDDAGADLIATAMNPKGKPVSIYSAKYAESQAAAKFARIGELHKDMPAMQKRIEMDIAAGGPKRDSALAVRMITLTGLRNGGEAGGGKVPTYGASSLRMQHVKVDGDTIRLDFMGKKGVRQRHTVRDSVLANHIRERQKTGASGMDRLFDTNDKRTLAYVQSISGNKFKVHDFRTWHGTVLAHRVINKTGQRGEWPTNEKQFKAFQMRVGRVVSRRLGNDPQMALKAYIHPAVFNQVKNPTE